MKTVIPLGILLLVLMLTACGDRKANLANGASVTVSSDAPIPVASVSPPTSTPVSSSPAGEANSEKEDDSIRAIGTHSDGRLLVKPASQANVAPLGAPSCYGVETDLRWSGDYEVLWESKSQGTSTKIMTFPIDFEIVQQNDSPVMMRPFTFEDTDIFAYVPRIPIANGELIVTGGYGAGQDFINVYHFQYDPKKRSMILRSTDQVIPNKI